MNYAYVTKVGFLTDITAFGTTSTSNFFLYCFLQGCVANRAAGGEAGEAVSAMSMAHGSAGGSLEDTTLDEPVSETLNRELRAIAKKLHKVAWMNSDSKVGLFPACLPASLPWLHILACLPPHARSLPCARSRFEQLRATKGDCKGRCLSRGGGEGERAVRGMEDTPALLKTHMPGLGFRPKP
jgi:hypothetical protein